MEAPLIHRFSRTSNHAFNIPFVSRMSIFETLPVSPCHTSVLLAFLPVSPCPFPPEILCNTQVLRGMCSIVSMSLVLLAPGSGSLRYRPLCLHSLI